MPSLQSLESLLAVLETGSVTGAARRLHVSQPALSHRLASLETAAGTALLERLPRGVRPTAAGRAMAADARIAVDAAARAVETARAVGAGAAGTLRIGVAESMTVPVLAPALLSWRRTHAAVRLEIEEATSANALAEGVADGRFDLAVGPRPDSPPGVVTVIGREEIVVAMASDHPLADRRQNPALAELAASPVVHCTPDNGLRVWLDAEAAAAGVALVPAVETRQATSAALLAATGLGAALVPVSAIRSAFPGRLRHLRPKLRRDIVAISSGDDDPLERSLRAELVSAGVEVPAELHASRGRT